MPQDDADPAELTGRITTDATRFAQVPEWLLDHPDVTPGALKLYCILARYADRVGRCWPGQATLAARCRVSEQTIRNQLRVLKQADAVDWKPRKTKTGWRNDYFLRFRDPHPSPAPETDPPDMVGGVRNSACGPGKETAGNTPPNATEIADGSASEVAENESHENDNHNSGGGNGSLCGSRALDAWIAAAAAAGLEKEELGKRSREKAAAAFAAVGWSPSGAAARVEFAACHRHWWRWLGRGVMAFIARCKGDLSEFDEDYRRVRAVPAYSSKRPALPAEEAEEAANGD